MINYTEFKKSLVVAEIDVEEIEEYSDKETTEIIITASHEGIAFMFSNKTGELKRVEARN